MKLSIQLTKKHVFLISLLILLIGIGIVYAYGGNSPTTMEHSSGELDVVINGVTKTLQEAIDAGDLGGTSGGDITGVVAGGGLSGGG